MVNAKKANAFLWIGNVLLIIGIVAFAFQFLIFPETRVPDFKQPTSVPPLQTLNDPTDTSALAKLPNPLLPKVTVDGGPTIRGPVKLIGTDSIAGDANAATAYLVVAQRQLYINAYVGEKIRDESAGVEVPEMSGWILQSVTPKSAVFTTPEGPRTLQLEEVTASAAPAGPGPISTSLVAGTQWDPSKYTSKKNAQRSNDSAEAWDIDRKEVEWAAANYESILAGVSLEPYPGGGLKINTLPEVGFAAERGLRAGDVIRAVNGQPIESIAKLQEVMSKLSRNATTLTVTLDRSGRAYSLTYTVPRPTR